MESCFMMKEPVWHSKECTLKPSQNAEVTNRDQRNDRGRRDVSLREGNSVNTGRGENELGDLTNQANTCFRWDMRGWLRTFWKIGLRDKCQLVEVLAGQTEGL